MKCFLIVFVGFFVVVLLVFFVQSCVGTFVWSLDNVLVCDKSVAYIK